jgi:hypothetical protein
MPNDANNSASSKKKRTKRKPKSPLLRDTCTCGLCHGQCAVYTQYIECRQKTV